MADYRLGRVEVINLINRKSVVGVAGGADFPSIRNVSSLLVPAATVAAGAALDARGARVFAVFLGFFVMS
jgi:hypothetical protein